MRDMGKSIFGSLQDSTNGTIVRFRHKLISEFLASAPHDVSQGKPAHIPAIAALHPSPVGGAGNLPPRHDIVVGGLI